jgi:hypothetical protein
MFCGLSSTIDGQLVLVVALLDHSENASERMHSRNNRGACYGGIIDSKESKVVTTWNNCRQQQAAEINALAASILAAKMMMTKNSLIQMSKELVDEVRRDG